jgi:proteic killer suppression protein
MIKSFKCKETEALFYGTYIKKLPANLLRRAQRKLKMIDAASLLRTLEIPPGNRLEPLKGDRLGQHSIRINDKWRICFIWNSGNAWQVEIVDYHG